MKMLIFLRLILVFNILWFIFQVVRAVFDSMNGEFGMGNVLDMLTWAALALTYIFLGNNQARNVKREYQEKEERERLRGPRI